MKIVASRKTAATVSVLSLFAIALLAPAAPAASQQPIKPRAEEAKAKQEEAAKKQERTEKVPDAEARTVAGKAAHYEKVHRERMGRLRRLLSIYREKGDEKKVAELQTMQDQLEKRHTNAMQGFRKQLGEERWAKVEKHIGGPSARALEVRNERANENAAERELRKAEKEAEGRPEKKGEERPKPDKDKDKDKDRDNEKEKEKEKDKEKPPGGNGGGR